MPKAEVFVKGIAHPFPLMILTFVHSKVTTILEDAHHFSMWEARVLKGQALPLPRNAWSERMGRF